MQHHTLQQFMANKEKWAQVQDPTSVGYAKYQEMIIVLLCFAERLRFLRQLIAIMTEKYFESLKRRNSTAYAEAYSYFYPRMLSADVSVLGDDFETGIPVEVSSVPIMHPTEEGGVFIAEKATFNSLMGFLQTEFYWGLSQDNAPRRCHNCGRYFLLRQDTTPATAGYNTCYCNNIAPGETVRTCRKVGAHRKEAQGKENRAPAQKEYDRAYNRLKVRKQRGKISKDEWNDAVAKAQELVAQSERGELTDEELKRKLKEL